MDFNFFYVLLSRDNELIIPLTRYNKGGNESVS